MIAAAPAPGSPDLTPYVLYSQSWRDAWDPVTSTFSRVPVDGLSTQDCLAFLLSLPSHAQLFAYSFNYDLTKILEGVDDATLYALARPEDRQRVGADAARGPTPVLYAGFWLNLQGTKFTVARDGWRATVWDIFKFYGTKFVTALTEWKIGTEAQRAKMQVMKEKRGAFDKEDPDAVEAYCLDECGCMAEAAAKLIAAHDAVGLTLKTFYGAGSTGGALLKKIGILEQIRPVLPSMALAVACAFFGGRFENSASARSASTSGTTTFPARTRTRWAFLPCLAHGHWVKTTARRDLDGAQHALVEYGFGGRIADAEAVSWGPFPFREADGSICFPHVSGGGWVYLREFLAGERLFPHVRMRQAWVYVCECDCQASSRRSPFTTCIGRWWERTPGQASRSSWASIPGMGRSRRVWATRFSTSGCGRE